MKKPTRRKEGKELLESIMRIDNELAYIKQEIPRIFDYLENTTLKFDYLENTTLKIHPSKK